ncbi:uncharacterized protein [Engystomops pustulosus]|uniref:uncharacterized protein n=1 Tax=Engystomops pustulosus TaxID=76066 RepID=UPI003AFAE378
MLYADDILLCLKDSGTSVPTVLSKINEFGSERETTEEEESASPSMMSSEIPQNDLQEIKTSKITRGYYARGKLLSIAEIHRYLSSLQNIKSAGKSMMRNIKRVGSDEFLHAPLEFPVFALQHVTSYESAKKILELESFKGRKHERPEFHDLSFWSADISSDDIKKSRLQIYEKMRTVVKAEEMETFHEEMKEQFANSPAFDKMASRYGNFAFSFPLSLLLWRYKTQHCKPREPQLRILGTDIYKQEIAHYIVVHSPDTKDFNDLPLIPNMPNRSIGWEDNTLFWKPESTSISLLLDVSKNSCSVRNYDPQPEAKPRHKIRPHVPRCVWNQLVVAFHLPHDGELKIPGQYLLRNLMPCHALQPFLKKHPIQKHQAREMIRTLRNRTKRTSGTTSLDSRTISKKTKKSPHDTTRFRILQNLKRMRRRK